MSRLEETEIILMKVASGSNLLNDIESTYINPFIKYYFDYTL